MLPADTVLQGDKKRRGRRNGLRKNVNHTRKLDPADETLPLEEVREPTPDPEVLKDEAEVEEKKSPYTIVRPPPRVSDSVFVQRLLRTRVSMYDVCHVSAGARGRSGQHGGT